MDYEKTIIEENEVLGNQAQGHNMALKSCKTCGEWKHSIDDFSSKGKSRKSRDNNCKACASQIRSQRKKNKTQNAMKEKEENRKELIKENLKKKITASYGRIEIARDSELEKIDELIRKIMNG